MKRQILVHNLSKLTKLNPIDFYVHTIVVYEATRHLQIP